MSWRTADQPVVAEPRLLCIGAGVVAGIDGGHVDGDERPRAGCYRGARHLCQGQSKLNFGDLSLATESEAKLLAENIGVTGNRLRLETTDTIDVTSGALAVDTASATLTTADSIVASTKSADIAISDSATLAAGATDVRIHRDASVDVGGSGAATFGDGLSVSGGLCLSRAAIVSALRARWQ